METKVVLKDITVGGKTLRGHFEAINHRNAIFYVEDIIREKVPFSKYSPTYLKNIDDENARHYRQQNVLITGATINLPNHTLLNDKMTQFTDQYNTKAHHLHPVKRAAKIYADFVAIHPFIIVKQKLS